MRSISTYRLLIFAPSKSCRPLKKVALASVTEPLEGRVLLSNVVVNTIVDSTDMAGSGIVSLRDAVAVANASSSATTITFDPTVFATPQTITLSGTAISFTGNASTTITGPSATLTVSGNSQSGVFSISGSSSGLTISDLTIIKGNSTSGGGIYSNGWEVTLNNVTLSDNSASGNDGGGGGIYNGDAMTLNNVTVSNNSAADEGGGIYNYTGEFTGPGVMTLNNVTVSNNSAADQGGGIYNRIDNVDGFGGGMTLNNVTLSQNSATEGGGIYTYNRPSSTSYGGNMTLNTVTLAQNSAAEGGGIYTDDGYVGVYDSTLSANMASFSGGGIENGGPGIPLGMVNTIVAANTLSGNGTGPDADGSFSSLGYNLIGVTNGSSGWITSDLTGTAASPLNPYLTALTNNGGYTQTMWPLPNSPVIGNGSFSLIPTGITTDQRGLPRVYNGLVDIGAVEVQPNPAAASPVFSNLSLSARISFATASVVFYGTIAAGALIPPAGETVAITLNGVTQNAAINSQGNFTTLFSANTLPASNTPYQVTYSYSYAGDGNFNGVTDDTTTTLLVMPTNGTETPVYRLYSQVTKEHLYTADLNEYNTLGTRGWDQEGLAYDDYTGLITVGGVTTEPLYRLYNIPEQQHLWTTDANEYNTLKNFVGTWSVDGISGYIFPANGNTSTSLGAVPGSAALYRMSWPFNPSADLHLWTTDLNEYDTDAATYGWTKEGVIGYVM